MARQPSQPDTRDRAAAGFSGQSGRPDSLDKGPSPSFRERVRRLTADMRARVASGREIQLSAAPHREITEALRVLVYESGDEGWLRIRYGEGSTVTPARGE